LPLRDLLTWSETSFTSDARVRDWFTALSPYAGQPPILEREDQNEWPDGSGEREPLYFLGVSAKRYVLYNRLPDGSYRIRKFSNHGLGAYATITDADLDVKLLKSRPDVPPPHTVDDETGKPTSYPLGGPMWSYLLWYDFIVACETGCYRNGKPVPRNSDGGLYYSVLTAGTLADWNPPAYHQVTMSTWALFSQYSGEYGGVIDGLRPFNFITVLPPIRGALLLKRRFAQDEMADETVSFLNEYAQAGCPAFFTGYARTADEVERAHQDGRIYTRINNRVVALPAEIPLVTLAEQLEGYFLHPEAKAARPNGAGDLGVRRVRVGDIYITGKETNRNALLAAEESDGILDGDEAWGGQVYGLDSLALGEARDWRALLKTYRLSDLILATGVPERTLSKIRNGQTKTPDETTAHAILAGLPLLDTRNPDRILGWRTARLPDMVPISVLVYALRQARGIADDGSPSEDEMVAVREVRKGTRHLPDNERLALIAAIQSYQRQQRQDDGDTPTAAESDARTFVDGLWSQEGVGQSVSRGVRSYSADEFTRLIEQGVLQ